MFSRQQKMTQETVTKGKKMKGNLIKPDFTRSVVNVSATLAEFLGCPNEKPVLPALKEALAHGYKNVVFLILDGMGLHPMRCNLEEHAFLRSHVVQTLTSVFPSTTTNATTSFLTNRYPMEHGWFGWTLYFKNIKKVVEIFPEKDANTGEPIEHGFMERQLPTKPYYAEANSDYALHTVVPEYWRHGGAEQHTWHTLEEIYSHISQICSLHGKQFIYAYCSEPDSTMHRFGVTSEEAKSMLTGIDRALQTLCGELSDTLLIVTADHGQTDIDENIELYRDEELLSLLAWPPYLESRAVAFRVKRGKKREFCALFREKYGADFKLFRTQKLIEENYFGGVDLRHAPLLGDYIAVGTTHKVLRMRERSHDFKGHHTSLTKEEMEVPLILIEKA